MNRHVHVTVWQSDGAWWRRQWWWETWEFWQLVWWRSRLSTYDTPAAGASSQSAASSWEYGHLINWWLVCRVFIILELSYSIHRLSKMVLYGARLSYDGLCMRYIYSRSDFLVTALTNASHLAYTWAICGLFSHHMWSYIEGDVPRSSLHRDHQLSF